MNPQELSNSDFEMQLRKSYIKPRIERVSLVPMETVLGGCKNPNAPEGAGRLFEYCMLGPIAPCLDNSNDWS